ncbi:MAG: nitroreductase family protein, partial [Hylemonella sp.]
MNVDQAIQTRMSVRAFTNQPVTQEQITQILELASRAASGNNAQPWKVYVLQGKSKNGLVEKVCAAHDALRADPSLASQYPEEYDYY